jgi:hypothetical protein
MRTGKMDMECKTCKYWDQEVMESHGDGIGECRRFPPFISDQIYKKQLVASNGNIEDARWIATIYPITAQQDWCGEWKAKD